jgi:hypothetical protein
MRAIKHVKLAHPDRFTPAALLNYVSSESGNTYAIPTF